MKHPEYLIIGRDMCWYCTEAKKLLDAKKIPYAYRDIRDVNEADYLTLIKIAEIEKMETVPQIYKYKHGGGLMYIGGYTELKKYFEDLENNS